jgi:hypothetical protein
MKWLILTLFATGFAHAGTVLLQGPHTSNIEYLGMLKAHPQMLSPVQEYLNAHPLPVNRERLLALYSEAQKSFLEKSTEESMVRFKNLLALVRADDWEKSDREIFLQAYLRLAQMEPDAERRERWLGQSLLLGRVNFDPDLYPPPLIAKRAELEKHLPKKDITRKFFAAGWNEILLNGQSCKKGECAGWPLYPGPARVTFLSDQWAPQTEVIDLAEVERHFPKTEAWAEGDCAKNSLNPAAGRFEDSRVFWGLSCEKPDSAALNLKPVTAPVNEPVPLFTTAVPNSKPFYQSPWFWAGAAVVAAVVIVANSKTKETKEPSTTYGY